MLDFPWAWKPPAEIRKRALTRATNCTLQDVADEGGLWPIALLSANIRFFDTHTQRRAAGIHIYLYVFQSVLINQTRGQKSERESGCADGLLSLLQLSTLLLRFFTRSIFSTLLLFYILFTYSQHKKKSKKIKMLSIKSCFFFRF